MWILNYIRSLNPRLARIEQKQELIMATLQEIVDEVAGQKTVVDGIQAFVDGLRAQIGSIPSISAVDQAKIDSIFAAVDANTKAITAALTFNTPPVVPPVSEPPPPVVEPSA